MIKGLAAVGPAFKNQRSSASHVCRVLLASEAGRQQPGPPARPRLSCALDAEDLRHDAWLAQLSGLTYRPADQLQQQLQTHGLQLVAKGRSWCTAWYVADRPPQGGSTPASSAPGNSQQVPERFVLSRGVSWSSPDVDSLRVWRSLSQAWPAPFQENRTQPRGALVAHSGVAAMAAELWREVGPYIASAPGNVAVAGHSLGGSLSLLLAVVAQLELGMPGSRLSCTTFGSPPVLSLRHGADGGRQILEALGMEPCSVRNYVLDNDPVPRALLSVDPTFEALKASPAVAGLLQLRERVLGPGAVLSPTRFLYHAVGAVLLLRWTQEQGYSMRELAGEQLADELRLDVEGIRQQPMRLVQALLDHHHGSYTQAIQSSAAALARQAEAG